MAPCRRRNAHFPVADRRSGQTAILDNKDIDVPTQREMLANFRCDELAEDAWTDFMSCVRSELSETIERSGFVDNFGAIAADLVTQLLMAFDDASQFYHVGVRARKRAQLEVRAYEVLRPLFDSVLSALVTAQSDAYERTLSAHRSATDPAVAARAFAEDLKQLRQSAEASFRQRASAMLVVGSGWSTDPAVESFARSCAAIAQRERVSLIDALLAQLQTSMESQLDEALGELLESAASTMWAQVRACYQATLSQFTDRLQTFAAGLEASADELVEWRRRLQEASASSAQRRVKAVISHLGHLMSKRYERRFKCDAQGVPRVWHSSEEIRAAYIAARGAVRACGCAGGAVRCATDPPAPPDRTIGRTAAAGSRAAQLVLHDPTGRSERQQCRYDC